MILTPDNEYCAVLDTSVLAPMPLCDTLLRCAEEPALYRLFWSETILDELHRTLLTKFRYTTEQCNHRIRKMREAFPEACIQFPEELLSAIPALPDPDDRHVVAAAIQQNAHVIVTSNLKDFPEDILARYGILVHSPDDFLVHQFHLNPQRVLDVLDTQASGIGGQRQEIVERLKRMLPQFAQLINPVC